MTSDPLTPPFQIRAVEFDRDGRLTTQDGRPVYRFAPRGHANPFVPTQRIPFGDAWPWYLQAWLRARVLPVPFGVNTPNDPDFAARDRAGTAFFPYPQLAYRGWRLYVLATPDPRAPVPEVLEHLWAPVARDLAPPERVGDVPDPDGNTNYMGP